MTISRRAIIAGALLAPMLPAPGACAAAEPDPWLAALRGRATGTGLLRSYDVSGTTDFDRAHGNCAYVYDNAVAGIALLASGETQSAVRIGQALLAAQSRDRFFTDGRLRNAYAAGPAPISGFYPMAGWWDPAQKRWLEDGYQAGTATGVVAWAMLFWIALSGATHDPGYLHAANRAADWIERTQRRPKGFAGGLLGFERAQQRLTWVSTEHNIDLQAAFAALGRSEQARHAGDFVTSMWDAKQRRFYSGLKPDGTVNDHSAVDANLWPLLAQHTQPEWLGALDWIIAEHGLPPNNPARTDGVDFNNDRDGIWLEGTAITALTAEKYERPALALRLMKTLREQTAPDGLIYACSTPTLTTGLSTGLDTRAPDFLYYRRPHIAPTAWAVLAKSGQNPFPHA